MTLRPDAPGPLRRRGPRPISLHLGPSPAMADKPLLAGIARYRRHPYQRELPDPPTIWSEADTRLLDYGIGQRGPRVLFVPSLVNRAYVLDLLPDRSLLRWLAQQGIRPLLLDWGWPGAEERRFGLSELIAGRLQRALHAVPGRPVLAGYCMGGLLALALALRQPRKLRGLALLATPWDFHAEFAAEAVALGQSLPSLEPLLASTGTLPVDALQTLFAAVEPGSVAAKYRAFAGLEEASPAVRDFVALEDWLNDGVPLAAPVAREVLQGWYRDNLPARGEWAVAGVPVRPQALRCPAFLAIPSRDRIVPPGSALSLAAAIPGAVIHRPRAGHIGMTAGPRAPTQLWHPFLDWLRGL